MVLGVDVLICGGIGPGAQNALSQIGLKLCAGVAGDADAAVEALIAGELECQACATCDHNHGGDHNCGEHSCGEHHNCGGSCH